MSEIIHVSKKQKVEFTFCKRNHIWVYIKLTMLDKMGNVLYSEDEEEYKKIFMFDTGAQNTILARNRVDDFGYNNCKVIGRTKAVGVGSGGMQCSKIEIPDISITDDIIIHKPAVLVPDDYDLNINILGQDILKLFNYYMDNNSQNIYFDKEKFEV